MTDCLQTLKVQQEMNIQYLCDNDINVDGVGRRSVDMT